jgi:hypothetical protein
MDTLEQIVHEALDNAKDNGYALTEDPLVIADDLVEYHQSLETFPPCALTAHVKSWQAKQGVTP